MVERPTFDLQYFRMILIMETIRKPLGCHIYSVQQVCTHLDLREAVRSSNVNPPAASQERRIAEE